MKSGKVTLITTVFNEEQSIGAFIESISSQTLVPDEIIIAGNGSVSRQVLDKDYPVRLRTKENGSYYFGQFYSDNTNSSCKRGKSGYGDI